MFVQEFIQLSRLGLTVRVALIPMPCADGNGRYSPIDTAKNTPKISLLFERAGKPIDAKPWDQVVSGEKSLVLRDGTVLDTDDLNIIDGEGWEILGQYGLLPNAFV